jgi:hypothetical protein
LAQIIFSLREDALRQSKDGEAADAGTPEDSSPAAAQNTLHPRRNSLGNPFLISTALPPAVRGKRDILGKAGKIRWMLMLFLAMDGD